MKKIVREKVVPNLLQQKQEFYNEKLNEFVNKRWQNE